MTTTRFSRYRSTRIVDGCKECRCYGNEIEHEEIREIYANYKESIAKILIDGIIEGDFKKSTSPIDHARFIVGSIDGILQQYISDHTHVHKVFNSGEKFSEYVMTLFV